MHPFETIDHVVRKGDTFLAYTQANVLVVELDEEGLGDLQAMRPTIRVERQVVRDFEVLVMTAKITFLRKDASPRVVDGINVPQGQYVLVAGQIDPTTNGIYVVHQVGRDGAFWVRASEQPSRGDRILVKRGSRAGEIWVWADDHVVDRNGLPPATTT